MTSARKYWSLGWLWKLLKGGFDWAMHNPIILVLIVILIIYNEAASSSSILNRVHVDWTKASSIWSTLVTLIQFTFTPTGIVLSIVGLVAGAVLTIFEVEANFVIFAKRERPLLQGARAVFTWRTVEYFVLQVIVSGALIIAFLLLAYVITILLGLTGLLGSLLLLVLVIIGYPTWYMTLATGVIICDSHVSGKQKLEMAGTALRRENLARLVPFYFIRVGIETVAASLAVLIASFLHLPNIFYVIVLILVATVPFAIIRSGGYLLKFDIFKDIPWYQEYFAAIYA